MMIPAALTVALSIDPMAGLGDMPNAMFGINAMTGGLSAEVTQPQTNSITLKGQDALNDIFENCIDLAGVASPGDTIISINWGDRALHNNVLNGCTDLTQHSYAQTGTYIVQVHVYTLGPTNRPTEVYIGSTTIDF